MFGTSGRAWPLENLLAGGMVMRATRGLPTADTTGSYNSRFLSTCWADIEHVEALGFMGFCVSTAALAREREAGWDTEGQFATTR